MRALSPGLLAAAMACLHAVAAHAGETAPIALGTSGLAVSVSLAGLDEQPLTEAPVGDAFRIRIGFARPGGGNAGVTNPIAWLRRTGASAATCQDSARSARVTGRLAADDVALAGLSVVTMDAANRIAIVDPNRPASARIVAGIVEIGEEPGGVAVHPGRGELVFSRPVQGDVMAVPLPWGRPRVLATGIDRPGTVLPAPGGRLWVAARDRVLLLDRNGEAIRAETMAGMARLFEAGSSRVLAAGSDGAATLMDRPTGTILASFPAGSAGAIAAATRDALLTDRDGRLIRLYADAPDRSDVLDLPGRLVSLKADPAGRWAVAVTRGDGTPEAGYELHVIDLALGRRVHAFSAPEVFDEAVMTDAAVFLTWPSRAVVTVVDLASLSKGDAAVRDVRLNAATSSNVGARRGAMMVALSPLSAVAVMRPGGRTLHTVLAGGGLSSSPIQAIELKGDAPVALAAYPRSLVEREPGVFEATARLPQGGRWELVATTGTGGTTACLPLPVVAQPEPPPPPSLSATIVARQGDMATLAVSLRDWPRRPPGRGLRLRIAAIDGSDIHDLDAHASEAGYLTSPFRVRPTLYAVSLADGATRPDPAVVDFARIARSGGNE